MTTTRPISPARERHQRETAARHQHERRLRLIRRGLLLLVIATVIPLVAYALKSATPISSTTASPAAAFTLPTTTGATVTLGSFRGKPVILYFNEGAGCGSCSAQMAEIEKDPAFASAGLTVLPIVMNTADQIRPDLDRYGVTTPYLLDDGSVSKAYGVLGKGMHAGLPGHSFVLIDKDGVTRWTGNYPSMWLAPGDLLKEVQSRL